MYGYSPYNQYTNPYQARLDSMQQPTQPMQITQVSGKNGADAYQMPPNSSILLLDNSQPIVWLKTTDGAGFPTCTPYKISPYQAQPQPDYDSLNQRITRLEEMLNGKSNASTAQQTAASAESYADAKPAQPVSTVNSRKKS